MRIKILVTRKINDSAIKLLKEYFDVDCINKNEPLNPNFLINNLCKYDGVLTTITEKITQNVLVNCKDNLKAISNMAAGFDNIDIKTAEDFGIKVFNTPDIVNDSTADMTIAMALTFLRKINEACKYVIDDKWKAWDPEVFNGHTLRYLTWGIIGLGRVGKVVAKRLSGFDTKILFFDNDKNTGRLENIDIEYKNYEDVLEESDIISFHIPLNENNRYSVNLDTFKMMKKKPVILNMSRGEIIVTDSLIYALENDMISGAILDVTDPEPISANHPLLQFKNILITPHIGTATLECRRDMALKAAQNLIDYFV